MKYHIDDAVDTAVTRAHITCENVVRKFTSEETKKDVDAAIATIHEAFSVLKAEIADAPKRALLNEWREEVAKGSTTYGFHAWKIHKRKNK